MGRPRKYTYEEKIIKKKEWNKKYYDKKKAQKLCPDCTSGEVGIYVRCAPCRAKHSIVNKNWRQKNASNSRSY